MEAPCFTADLLPGQGCLPVSKLVSCHSTDAQLELTEKDVKNSFHTGKGGRVGERPIPANKRET